MPTIRLIALARSPLARRALAGAVLVGLVLLIGRLFIESPLEVEVLYRFGGEAPRLRGVRIEYIDTMRPNTGARSLSWEFGSGGAPAEKSHTTHLLPGDHRVGLRLRDVDGEWRSADTNIDVPFSGGRVVVDVPQAVAAAAGVATVAGAAEPDAAR